MVKELRKKGRTLYLCEECGIAYSEKMWAEKCGLYNRTKPVA